MIELTVPFVVDDKLSEWCRLTHPGVKIVGVGASLSGHPRLHIDRLVGEHQILKSLKVGQVCDVGGNPQRHAVFNRDNVWSCCPLLSGQDHIRNRKYDGLANWCSHLAQHCNCKTFDGFMFIHSVYYIKPAELFSLCCKGPAYVLIHEFDGLSGKYYDEADYKCVTIKGVRNVEMSVTGCSYMYQHTTPEWILDGGYTCAKGQLICNKIREVGSMSIYSVNYSRWAYDLSINPRSTPVERIWKDVSDAKDGREVTTIGDHVIPVALLNELYFHALCNERPKRHSLMIMANRWLRTWTSSTGATKVVTVAVVAVDWVMATYEEVGYHKELRTTGRNFLVVFFVWLFTLFRNLCRNLTYPFRCRERQNVPGVTCDLQPLTNCVKLIQEPTNHSDKTSEVYVQGPNIYTDDVTVYNQDVNNTVKCINERAFAPLELIDDALFNEFDKWLPTFWKKLFPVIRKTFEPTQFEDWNRRFPQVSATRHQKVYEEMRQLTKRDCVLRDCFLKQEITYKGENGVARLITGVTDIFKITVGPYLYKLSKIVGKKLKDTDTVYAPGLNMLELGSFVNLTQESISTDMSRFDSCVTERHMTSMLSFYKHFNFPPEIMKALKDSIGQKCYFRNGMCVEPLVPRRSSGHPNTTLENTMLNLALHSFAFHKTGESVRLMAGGDDIIIQGCNDMAFADVLRRLGFKPKTKLCSRGKAEFYSGWFLPVQNGVALTPKIGRQLRKLGLSVSKKDTFAESVLSARAIFSHVEPVSALLNVFPVTGSPSVKIKPNYMLAPEPITPDEYTLMALEDIYPDITGVCATLRESLSGGNERVINTLIDLLLEHE